MIIRNPIYLPLLCLGDGRHNVEVCIMECNMVSLQTLPPMVEHHSGMEILSVLVLDDDPTSLLVTTRMLEKLNFKVFPFQTELAALDFLKKVDAKEEELDLILAEVHVSTRASRSLENSELLSRIRNERHVPFVSMCANDNEEASSECMAVGACFHLPKPLTAGSFNMLRDTARQHKSRRAAIKQQHLKGHTNSTKRDRFHSKKLDRLIWTVELQEKFLEAIEVLGDKNAVPSRIVKQMNVKDLTAKQIASHLQKHRSRMKAYQRKFQQNASKKVVPELIRSEHNDSTTVCITPKVAADIRELYPSRLWTNVKKMLAEAVSLKAYSYMCISGIFRDDTSSVWDKYHKSLQNCLSSRRWEYEQPTKGKDVVRYEDSSSESLETAGEIGHGVPFESSGSNIMLTSSLGQTEKNNLTETAVTYPSDGCLHNDALLNDTSKSSSTQMYMAGPADDREELISFWMSHMNPQEPLNVSVEDLLQVDEVWNEALVWGTQPSLVNVIEPITQETTVEETLVPDPVMQSAQTQEAAVGDAQVPDPVVQFVQTQEVAVGAAPLHDHVMQFAQDDVYWSLSPSLADYDMLF